MGVGVLVEDALARPGAHGRGMRRVGEQLPYAVSASAPSSTTTISLPGVNHCSMPSCGLETIAAPVAASSNGRQVEESGTVACERRVTLRLIRAAEIARAKELKGTSPMLRALPTSPWKSRPPRAKSISGASRLGSPTMAAVHSRRNLSP